MFSKPDAQVWGQSNALGLAILIKVLIVRHTGLRPEKNPGSLCNLDFNAFNEYHLQSKKVKFKHLLIYF